MRGRRTFRLLPVTAVTFVLALALTGLACRARRATPGQGASELSAETPKTLYHCPMHPTYISDKPGDCAICGMQLVPMAATSPTPEVSAAPSASPKPGQRRILYYRSPMNPSVHSDKPAKDEMGMDFVPVYEGEEEAQTTAAGRAVVVLSPERRRVLGLRTQMVREEPLTREIRTVGRVAADERRIHHVHTKYDAYVEHLYVDFTGKLVARGDHLVALYSPELIATQEEYLLALKARDRFRQEGLADVAQRGDELVEAARQRLILWDVAPEDIAQIERTRTPVHALDLHSDVGGYVLEKNVVHGMRVTPADTLFDIADLSHLWVLADVYETDLPLIRIGMSAEVGVPYLPGKSWRGPVTYIAPTVEEKTRTIKVRIEVDNPAGLLRPDMFADVWLKSDIGRGPVVPETAVIYTGERKLVFVERADGGLEPREVSLGPKVAGGFQALSGVKAGERVATAANFLLDSESSLKAAIAAGLPADPAH